MVYSFWQSTHYERLELPVLLVLQGNDSSILKYHSLCERGEPMQARGERVESTQSEQASTEVRSLGSTLLQYTRQVNHYYEYEQQHGIGQSVLPRQSPMSRCQRIEVWRRLFALPSSVWRKLKVTASCSVTLFGSLITFSQMFSKVIWSAAVFVFHVRGALNDGQREWDTRRSSLQLALVLCVHQAYRLTKGARVSLSRKAFGAPCL